MEGSRYPPPVANCVPSRDQATDAAWPRCAGKPLTKAWVKAFHTLIPIDFPAASAPTAATHALLGEYAKRKTLPAKPKTGSVRSLSTKLIVPSKLAVTKLPEPFGAKLSEPTAGSPFAVWLSTFFGGPGLRKSQIQTFPSPPAE